MKTPAIFLILASVALVGGCAAPQTTTTTMRTESTSSRVKSDPTATKTYTQEELAATGQTQTADQLVKRDASISRSGGR
jgi:uncharacterized lipoprotein YajG